MADERVKVSAEIAKEFFDILEGLAVQRGVSANTVLRQAIQTEKFFADAVAAGKKVLVEHPDRRMDQVLLRHMRPA